MQRVSATSREGRRESPFSQALENLTNRLESCIIGNINLTGRKKCYGKPKFEAWKNQRERWRRGRKLAMVSIFCRFPSGGGSTVPHRLGFVRDSDTMPNGKGIRRRFLNSELRGEELICIVYWT